MGARQRIGRLTPYLLLAPGLLWLLVFYVYPSIQMFISSFWSGTLESGFAVSLSNWTTYPAALERYGPQFARSIVYGAAATVICFLIAYPLAYTIAFRGGRYKSLLLFLVIAPFFTSFLLRTQSWKIILGDDGILFGPLKDIGVLGPDFRVLATPAAVVAGIAYNFLPFMTLPIYVSLEKIDGRLVEAAKDLFAGPWRRGGAIAGAIVGGALAGGLAAAFEYAIVPFAIAGVGVGALIGTFFLSESFIRIVLPLSLPGVFAGSPRPGIQVLRRLDEADVDLLERHVDRQGHERQEVVRDPRHDRDRRRQHPELGRQDAQILQRPEQDAVIAEDDLPALRPEQEAREERRDDEEQEDVLVAAAAERDRVGERVRD